jgi:hypothetical protein
MSNLNKIRYSKEEYIKWMEKFLSTVEQLYKNGTISKYDYNKFKKSVKEGLKEYEK